MEMLKDSEFIHALMTFVVVIFAIGIGVILLYAHFQKNLLQQKLQQETIRNLHQHELLRNSIETQEEERKRIAQDLHDELGAVLSIIQMNLSMMERRQHVAPSLQTTEVAHLRHLAEVALVSMRHISHRLMPPQLEAFGLLEALQSVAGQLSKSSDIAIRLDGPAELSVLSRMIILNVYRIIMELISNTLKHAGATHISIDFRIENPYLICRYSDNGKGMEEGLESHHGIGQKSINTRISLLGGTFSVTTALGSGYQVIMQIPLSA